MTTPRLETRYDYKVFNDGAYLGLLPKVLSEFEYTQEINSSSTDLLVRVAGSLDTASEANEFITDEANVTILTESNEPLQTERSIEIIGPSNSSALIANNRDIEVWEYSTNHPNGVLVFYGYISRWEAESEDEDVVTLTIISHGKDMVDYIVGNAAYALEVNQSTVDAGGDTLHRLGQPSSQVPFLGQTLSGHSFVLSKIALSIAAGDANDGFIATSATITVKLYSGSPVGPSTLLGTMTKLITNVVPSYQWVDFALPQSVSLSGGSFWFSVESNDYATIQLSQLTGDHYAGGSLAGSDNGTSWTVFGGGADLGFRLYSGGVATNATFVDYDPSDMVTDSLDIYNAQGGSVTYTPSSIEATGLSLDYEFILATELEIVDKARELAPAGWYWFVDVASQILTFKSTDTTATHRMILGRHLGQFNIGSSIEDVKSVVYFTGGPTAGVNLLKMYSNPNAVTRGLEKLSDNRVTDSAVASALSQSVLDENEDEVFRASITVLAANYDITTLHPGDTVGFSGYGSFIDSLVLQITRMKRGVDFAILTLGPLPIRANTYIENIRRDLDKEQTLDNPSQPS